MLIVVSGPSGAGKGTLCNILLNRVENLFLSISATTRSPRAQEIHGESYFFLDKNDFENKIKNGDFLEWAKVYNNYYGTPKEFVNNMLNEGKDVILEIDTQGAAQVKRNCPAGVFIFISPPDIQELKKRIVKRGSETQDSIDLRVKRARDELKASLDYDYVVFNDDLDKAALKIQSIVLSERCKVSRNKKILQAILGGN
ncbi:MAG: guanylate kinase [Tepidanaerobacteraceae bacterium]|nr:guanylate kinase [Tepidanaerobacteraceae bacterium]